jgi:hypothetical protein
MFTAVTSVLAAGQSVGIFPEGGSHDRTSLLPLKVKGGGGGEGSKHTRGVCWSVVSRGLGREGAVIRVWVRLPRTSRR